MGLFVALVVLFISVHPENVERFALFPFGGDIGGKLFAECLGADERLAILFENVLIKNPDAQNDHCQRFFEFGDVLGTDAIEDAQAKDGIWKYVGTSRISHDKFQGAQLFFSRIDAIEYGNPAGCLHFVSWRYASIFNNHGDAKQPLVVPQGLLGIEKNVSSKLAIASVNLSLCGFGRGIGCLTSFDERSLQRVVGNAENDRIDNGRDKQQRSPSDQPSSEAINWNGLIEPPWLAGLASLCGLLIAGFGFLLLFGAHSALTPRLQLVGVTFLFAGLATFAIGALTAVAFL